jgi:glycosyltransferase involved in cell wall biosynthesis
MPTYNRRHFAGKAIEYFLRQDYPNKQLVIVDDGTDPIADLVPHERDQFVYVRLTRKAPLGEKRNIAVENASADIILHWDDDDWYAIHRISYQVGALLEENANICGLGNGFFYDICEDKFWRCSENLHNTLFAAQVIGGSLCYTRALWHRLGKFQPNCALAEDAYFLRKMRGNGDQILKLSNRNTLVYIRHGSNTWRFNCGQFFKPSDWICSVAFRDAIPNGDLAFYRQLGLTVKCS